MTVLSEKQFIIGQGIGPLSGKIDRWKLEALFSPNYAYGISIECNVVFIVVIIKGGFVDVVCGFDQGFALLGFQPVSLQFVVIFIGDTQDIGQGELSGLSLA